MNRLAHWTLFSMFSCGAALTAVSARTAFPDRPIHIVIGVPPGGGTDLIARLLAQELTQKWNVSVLVDNRPGADNTIAAEAVAHAPPDGYMLDLTATNHTMTPNFYKLSYDPVTSFAPVIYLGTQPDMLVVNNSVPVKTVKELIAYAKAKPSQLNFGSGGTANPPYAEMMILAKETGMKLVNVPFKGSGPVLTAVLGGEVQMAFAGFAEGKEEVEAGKLKGLAVSTDKRVPLMPNVPTVAEAAGLPDFNLGAWYGVLAPAGTPGEIVDKINRDMAAAMKSPEVQAKLAARGFLTAPDTAAEFKDFLIADVARWRSVLAGSSGK